MSTYALVQRGVAHADNTTGAGVSPLDIALGTPLKLGTAFVVARPRDRREDIIVQRGSQAITSASVSPIDVAITAVDMTAAEVGGTFKEFRTNNRHGATWKLQSATVLRIAFDTVAAGDTIDIEWEVREHKARRGATLRILNANTLRLEWDGTLVAGESIDVAFDVFDLDDFGDDVKEILFREVRILGYLGEAKLQDLMVYDTPGNLVAYRVRVFDTKAHADGATIDLDDAQNLETGELARYNVTVDIDKEFNDRQSLKMVRTKLATNPDIN